MYNKSYILDNVIAIADIDKFVEDMNAQPKRPMAPPADPAADAVKMDTQVFLYAGDGCAIYYTLDGTNPTYEDGVCTNGTLYETYSMGYGQEDASYIELKKDRPFYFYDSNRELYKKNIKGFQAILHDDAVGKYDDENEYEYDDYYIVAIPSDDSEPIVLSEDPDTCPCPFQTTVEIYDVINNKYNIL